MDANEGKGWIIKMAQKNKETQTGRPEMPWLAGSEYFPTTAAFVNNGFMAPAPFGQQFYMNREEELYRRACLLKGINVQQPQMYIEDLEENESTGSEEETSKSVYRYTLDEMKSYNPYKFIKF